MLSPGLSGPLVGPLRGDLGHLPPLKVRNLFALIARASVARWRCRLPPQFVRQRHGPRARDHGLRSQLHIGRLRVAPLLEYRYLALLVPKPLIDKTKRFRQMAAEYTELHDKVQALISDLIFATTRGYIRKAGGPDVSFSLGGGEWKFVFGASHTSFKENYNRILEMVGGYVEKAPVAVGSVSDFEIQLRATLLPVEEARQMMQLRDDLLALGKELSADIEPFIKAPYTL